MTLVTRELADHGIRQAVGITTGPVIAKMQFERAATTVAVRFVESEADARALLADLNSTGA
jgi:hypothetical protein